MKTYEILVKNRAVHAGGRDMSVIRTSSGVDRIHVLFDSSEWTEFPVTVSFANGDSVITETIVLSDVTNSEYEAEAYADVPPEVALSTGKVRVTFQGTDSDGRHIITAKGSPLSIIESGDVDAGEPPSESQTVSQWQQAYADAMAAVNSAQSLVSNLEDSMDDVVTDASSQIDDKVTEAVETITQLVEQFETTLNSLIATKSSLGMMKVGDGLDVEQDGTVSVTAVTGITQQQSSALLNLQLLATYAFDTEFDVTGVLRDTVRLKSSALPSDIEQGA